MIENELRIAPEQSSNKTEDIENTWYYKDPIYNLCIQLSYLSSSSSESFGAVAIQSQKVIGLGWNIYMGGETGLRRQGYANHAEFQAVSIAEALGYDLNTQENETCIYVAGRVVKDDILYCSPISIPFTCVTCAKALDKYFKNISLATPTKNNGWRYVSAEEAYISSLYFKQNKFNRSKINTFTTNASVLNIGFTQEYIDNILNALNKSNIVIDERLKNILLHNYCSFFQLSSHERRRVIEDMINPRDTSL